MIKDAGIMLQIKKERLEKHLDDVEKLVKDWISHLSAPDPFAFDRRSDCWGWRSAYKPPLEQDPDSNHMLRKHLKSRALWRHHADWESRLDRISQLVPLAYGKANEKMGEITSGKAQYTENYLGTALWQAFYSACDKSPYWEYRRVDYGVTVSFGGYPIAISSEPEEYDQIHQEHPRLAEKLATLQQVRGVAEEWGFVMRLQEQMRALAEKALKSSDFLYPCKFCKHLWKA